LVQRIFTILQRRGRLTIKLLQEHTQLNQRQLRHGLAVLIQQNLLYHFYEKESKETYYEANQDAAYWLLRSGKIMEIAEEKFGPVGLELVRDLHLLGQAKVSTLVNECEEEKSGANGKKNGTHAVNGLNGDSNGHSVSRVKQHTIARLVEAGMVQPVKKSMFRSPADTRNEIEKGLLKERYGGSTKGTKQKEELNVSIRAELEALRSDEMQWKPKGKKRAPLGEAGRINGSTKRRRLSHSEHAVNGNHHTKYEDDSAVLDVGFISFTQARSEANLYEGRLAPTN
jgi:DNA-directed RNA polymerase III subunit RPC3